MEVSSVEAIVRALNDNQVQYLIVGGLAVNAHGYVRLTRGVDLVMGLEPENARRGFCRKRYSTQGRKKTHRAQKKIQRLTL